MFKDGPWVIFFISRLQIAVKDLIAHLLQITHLGALKEFLVWYLGSVKIYERKSSLSHKAFLVQCASSRRESYTLIS